MSIDLQCNEMTVIVHACIVYMRHSRRDQQLNKTIPSVTGLR
jgi:hypothetical protein